MWSIFLLIMYLALKAWALQITGHGNTSADYGGDAHFKCKLDDPKDVLQVTWQRLFKDNSIENLATYSKRFGEQVNEPYKGKILLSEGSLQSSSITVRNVTWADESCYVCSFNAYPGGSKRHQTCLTVQGVSDVKTQVYTPIDQPESNRVIFSCSATGNPLPNIQWEYSHDIVEQSQTSVLTNDDRTLTSSRNMTLKMSPDWDGHVYCLINPGMRGEKRETIIYTRIEENAERDDNTIHSAIIVSIILAIIVISVVSTLLLKSLKKRAKMDALVRASGLFILLMTTGFLEGLKKEVIQQVHNDVKAGEEVHLHCPVKDPSDVLQVMWQKILSEDEVTVATCLSSRHRLNPEFSGRIGLRGAGVQNCSLVVHNVTRRDEGCYHCLIITHSDVAYTRETCLQIHELHGPVLNVTTSNSTGDVVVSCSATGRPAPNVTLHVPQKHRTQNSSMRNSNGTVTVVCTAELFQLKEAQECHCSVTSPFGHDTVVQTIPAPGSLTPISSKSRANQSDMDYGLVYVFYVGLACGCVMAIVVIAIVVHVVKKNLKGRT
ncbi:uncharacterized protein [Eucyclogobius newberryi]|uniref:uncharacterized protein n=1 Tax=Eucyclogobius newberryi TaxID=166745 RepID=UPI003B5A7EF3